MKVRRSRRGQALVEYLLLLCSTTAVALIVGGLLKKYAGELASKIFDAVLQTALNAAFG